MLNWSAIKGIAIISVVIGHCIQFPLVGLYVNQYHLAAFFFVSGYFFKEKYIDDKRSFVWKKVKKLYVLFVISGLIFLLSHPVLERMHVYGHPLSWNDYSREIINLVFRLTSNDPMMGAMWFCPALLGVSLLAFGLFCISKDWSLKSRTALFVAAVILGGVFTCIQNEKSVLRMAISDHNRYLLHGLVVSSDRGETS